jgi:hypothetical protein
VKTRFSFFILFFATKLFCQDKTDKVQSWTPEFGYTQQLFGSTLKGYDARIISPRFKFETEDDSWSEEEEKNPEEFKKGRFCVDAMYAGPHVDSNYTKKITEFSITGDFLYRLLQIKRFSLDAMGGIRFYFITAPDYVLINFQKMYYWDYGLLAQINLGFISPFVDVRRNGYYTAGAELTLHSVYRKPKKKYKAHKNLSR